MSRFGYAVSAVVLTGTLSLGVAFAQTPAPAAPAPAASDKAAAKQKKADCTKQAKEQKMTGAARTKFMKECTSKM